MCSHRCADRTYGQARVVQLRLIRRVGEQFRFVVLDL